ncbi:hypothetical protein PAMA_008863 [Pampus argenteus]
MINTLANACQNPPNTPAHYPARTSEEEVRSIFNRGRPTTGQAAAYRANLSMPSTSQECPNTAPVYNLRPYTRKGPRHCCTPNDTNSLETISRHLEDHISIIATFTVLMSNVQQNIAERTLCVNLEGIYESLREMLAEITFQLEGDVQAHGMGTHSASQRGRPKYNIPADQLIHMRDLGFSWMAISWMLSVNIRTLYHRTQLGLVDYGSFTDTANADLDRLIAEILRQTPGFGETRERLRTVDPVGRALRG